MGATVSIITQPDRFSIVNAELWFQSTSTFSSAPGYKYIFDVFTYDQGSGVLLENLGRYQVPPRPDTGNGLFDPHKILKTQVSNSPLGFPITTTSSFASASIVEYNLDYGFQYDPNVVITGTLDFAGFLTLLGVTSSLFSAGDIITIQMDNTKLNPQYNGTCSITAVGAGGALTDISYGTASLAPPETGLVVNQLSIVGTTSHFFAYNGTRQYLERTRNFGTEFILRDYLITPFLTDFGSPAAVAPFTADYYKPLFRDQYETMGFLADTATYGISFIDFIGYRSDFSTAQFMSVTYSVPTYAHKMELGIGPMNIPLIFGTAINSQVVYYNVIPGNGIALRGAISRSIIPNCCLYQNKQVTWLNRFGSFEYWNFNLVNKKTTNTERTEYKKVLPFNYSIGDRGTTTMAQKINETFIANSDWLSEFQYSFLESLITSPEIYVIGGTQGTDRIPINITDNSWIQKTAVTDILYNLTISYKLAYDVNIQNL